mgnify:CR=1 FL=1
MLNIKENCTSISQKKRIRRIPWKLPERVYREAEERFDDAITGHEIAVKRVRYRGRLREVMVAADRRLGIVELITIHPLKPGQKQARVQSGRWKRL